LAALSAAGALAASAPAAHAVVFTRHPWLSLQTPTSMLVAWQTDLASSSRVLYGPDPVADWSAASAATQAGTTLDHAVSLTGLTPATRYRYRVISDADTLDAGSFRTAPGLPEPFRFLVFGDIGTATPDQKLIAARVDTLNADLAILPGDIIYDNGEPWNFTPYYFDIYRPTLKRIPFYPVLGNHDTYYDGGATFVGEFHLPANFASGPERSYSFDYSNAHFAAIEVVNENVAPPAAAVAWLDADLAASQKTWKFVYFHVPMYSNGGGHGGDASVAASLEPIFQARGVDMVFQGHNHFYTRTYPISAGQAVDQVQEPAYTNAHGPVYVVAGGGGRALYGLTAPASYEALSRSIYHVVAMDVAGDSLTLRAIQEDGTVFDSMTLRKETPTNAEDPPEEPAAGAPVFAIQRPRPNPAGGFADLRFTLSRSAAATLRIVDATGRLVRAIELGELDPGEHSWRWDGRDDRGRQAASGRYFVELRAGARRARTPLTLLR
jgi:calcineurin-like phosphoesterase family protein/flagellar hook capping protein FlgD/purple acid phosphatase-like protein